MFRLGETERLDSTALRCAVAGALCITLATVPTVGPSISFEWLRWLAPGMLIGAVASTWRERWRDLLFGGVAILGYAAFAGHAVFGDVLAGCVMGYGLTRHLRGTTESETADKLAWAKRLTAIGCAALAWPIGVEALRSVAANATSQGAVPPVVVQGVAGAVVGLFMGLTTVPLFLEGHGFATHEDAVTKALRTMQSMLDAELRTIVFSIAEARVRTLKLVQSSRASPRARSETNRSLDAVALASIELTNRFAAVDRILSRVPTTDLEQRLTDARQQLERATDPGIRRDVERTQTALEEQRLQVQRLRQGRARLVARLQSELASLERTEMSFALLASGEAALSGIQLETIGMGLVQQAQELEAEGTALQEMLTVSPHHALQKLAT